MHLDHDVVCPILIGRSHSSPVCDAFSRATGRNGGVALIVGEAGVGKSRLLRAMTDEARESGFFVLSGACFEAERSIPYAPLLDHRAALRGCGLACSSRTCLAPAVGLRHDLSRARSGLPAGRESESHHRSRDQQADGCFTRSREVHHDARRTQPVLLTLRGRALERRRHARAGVPPRAEPQHYSRSSSR